MEILLLLLVSPAIFAQRYWKHVNPNDEPFLPIHPVYPHNPKLTKRGFDKEIATVLKPELYAPRTDARDSYSASYAGNSKDSYFPGYGTSPQSSLPPYSPYYGNSPYVPYTNPYTANSYGANPYASGPHGPGSYPGYYHQPPYYFPDYYNQQQFPYSFPPPDHSESPGPQWNENSNSNQENPSAKSEKPKPSKPKVKESSSSSSNGSGSQYVDGNNLISQNYKDLTAQSSASKTSNPYNQLEQISNLYFKNVPLPPTTYKVISVGGQPVGPNYPLPSNYAGAQLREQVAAAKNLAKSLGHPHQMTGTEGSQGIPSHLDQEKFYSSEKNSIPKLFQEGQYYSDSLNAQIKSAEAHIYGSDDRDLPVKDSTNQFLPANQDSPSKLPNPQIYGDRQTSQNNPQTKHAIGQSDESFETFAHSPSSPIKIPSKYQSLPQAQKSGTRVTIQRSQSAYIPPGKIAPDLQDADPSSVLSYDQSSLSHSAPYRSEANYRPDQIQEMISYQNIVAQSMPQTYTYHGTNVPSFIPAGSHHQQQQQQQQHQLKTNLEDVNFGAKQGNKG